jgi:hypothetical protein
MTLWARPKLFENSLNGEVGEYMGSLISIGKCICCGKMSSLDDDGACSRCINDFGYKAGIIAKEIRNDDKFHMHVYDKIKKSKPHALPAFVEMFGRPLKAL